MHLAFRTSPPSNKLKTYFCYETLVTGHYKVYGSIRGLIIMVQSTCFSLVNKFCMLVCAPPANFDLVILPRSESTELYG